MKLAELTTEELELWAHSQSKDDLERLHHLIGIMLFEQNIPLYWNTTGEE